MNIEVNCYFCKKIFFRSARQYNESTKFGWAQYCSTQCISSSKMTGSVLRCANLACQKEFYKPRREIGKVKRSFCSHSCAAKANNPLRPTKHPIKICAFKGCRVKVAHPQRYCSIVHGVRSRSIPLDVQKQRIIERIKSFHKQNDRIPVKKEIYGIYKPARRFFGSWNNAIKFAGFDANPVLFAKRFVAKDGHKCDSFTEKIIDDWLHDNKIAHERNFKYGDTKMTADFVIGDKIILEFFGLAGVQKNYDRLITVKRNFCKDNNLSLIELYPKDIFPNNRLGEILLN